MLGAVLDASALLLTTVNTFLVYAGEEQVAAAAMWAICLAIYYQLITLLLSTRHPDS